MVVLACDGKPLLYNDGIYVSLFTVQCVALCVHFVCLLVGVDVVDEIIRCYWVRMFFYFDYLRLITTRNFFNVNL